MTDPKPAAVNVPPAEAAPATEDVSPQPASDKPEREESEAHPS